jgi:hypothetical protein
MSKIDDNDFRIEWDLHEFGPREAQAEHIAHGPKDPVKLLFALAVAHGDVPANTPTIEDKAA